MSIKKIGQNILQAVFFGYLKLLEKTVHMEWDEDRLYGNSQIFGFWHEDSFIMNLVLKNLRGKTAPVDVIVTADTRGNYIEHMIKKCGGNALRIPDGYAAFGALKKLMQSSYEQTRSHWTVRWDRVTSRKSWHSIFRNKAATILSGSACTILPVSGCSGDGITMRYRFRFPQ